MFSSRTRIHCSRHCSTFFLQSQRYWNTRENQTAQTFPETCAALEKGNEILPRERGQGKERYESLGREWNDEIVLGRLQKIECNLEFDWSWKVISPLRRVDRWVMTSSHLWESLAIGPASAGCAAALDPPQPCSKRPAVLWIRYEQPWAAIRRSLGGEWWGGRNRGGWRWKTTVIRITWGHGKRVFMKSWRSSCCCWNKVGTKVRGTDSDSVRATVSSSTSWLRFLGDKHPTWNAFEMSQNTCNFKWMGKKTGIYCFLPLLLKQEDKDWALKLHTHLYRPDSCDNKEAKPPEAGWNDPFGGCCLESEHIVDWRCFSFLRAQSHIEECKEKLSANLSQLINT